MQPVLLSRPLLKLTFSTNLVSSLESLLLLNEFDLELLLSLIFSGTIVKLFPDFGSSRRLFFVCVVFFVEHVTSL